MDKLQEVGKIVGVFHPEMPVRGDPSFMTSHCRVCRFSLFKAASWAASSKNEHQHRRIIIRFRSGVAFMTRRSLAHLIAFESVAQYILPKTINHTEFPLSM
jgi:hypothetical protein